MTVHRSPVGAVPRCRPACTSMSRLRSTQEREKAHIHRDSMATMGAPQGCRGPPTILPPSSKEHINNINPHPPLHSRHYPRLPSLPHQPTGGDAPRCAHLSQTPREETRLVVHTFPNPREETRLVVPFSQTHGRRRASLRLSNTPERYTRV